MPAEASSRPDIGLKRTETSTLSWEPPGATITVNSLAVARWTRARPWEAPGTSSVAHLPETVIQPSRGLVKSKRSAGACDRANRFPIDIDATIAAAVMRRRRVTGVAVDLERSSRMLLAFLTFDR